MTQTQNNAYCTSTFLLVPCGVGEQPTEDMTCEPCPLGSYQDQDFQKACITCPGRGTTDAVGATSVTQCSASASTSNASGCKDNDYRKQNTERV